MKIRANTESILVGIIAGVFSYLALISPATIAALAIRRKIPDAWFSNTENSRTQEFVLRWSRDIQYSSREIVRQQWNFSPPDSVRETEDYVVELSEVKVLELMIVPDKSGGEVRASLVSLRLA